MNSKKDKFAKLVDVKEDYRPQKGLWASGDYMRFCTKCSSHFIGDKRAVYCADGEYGSNVEEGKDES